MNQKFQNALAQVPQPTPPIWMMRQAGRYHSHYQEMKKKHDFVTLCKEPLLAAEVARGPVADFGFDVSILFSDLLFPLEAMGMGLTYNPGPVLSYHLNEENFGALKVDQTSIDALRFQREAMHQTRKVLPKDCSLIGFVGGPWTLFTYAVEGGHKGNMIEVKKNPELWPRFFDLLLPLLLSNIQLQLDGGAEVVMVLDTASGEVSSHYFREEIARRYEALVKAFPGKLGYYSKGTTWDHIKTPSLLEEDWAGLGFDHRFDLAEILRSQASPGFVQGNLDQALLFQPHARFKQTLETYLEPFKQLSEKDRAGWVCGLGHGILPQTPEENVRYFVKRVREVFQ